MIKIENLTKKYRIKNSFWDNFKKKRCKIALDGLSCSFPKEVITCLIGPNGSGKTTTMRTILNLIPKDAGTIIVNNSFDSVTDFKKIRKMTGYLPEEGGLYDKTKATRMLYFFADMYGVKNWRETAEDLLTKFDLFSVRNQKIGSFSKGMKQKLSIARMMIQNPEILLLDEPMTGLDPQSIKLLSDFLIDLKKNGKTIVVSTHLLEIAENICDRVVVIYRGKQLFEGSKEEFMALNGQKSFVDNYIALIKRAEGS